MTSHPPLRATDREREATVDALRAAFAAGCLNESELAERAGRAYAATTRDELHALLRDLPGELEPAEDRPRDQVADLGCRLGWEFGIMLAGAGAWLIVTGLHGVVAVPFILLWLVALRAWGWLPRLARRPGGRGPGKDDF